MTRRSAVKEVEDYLTPSEAGRLLGTSGTWVKRLVRRGDLEGVETHLGWLIRPESVERLAEERLKRAERRVSSLKAASSRAGSNKAKAASVRGRAAHGRTIGSRGRKS